MFRRLLARLLVVGCVLTAAASAPAQTAIVEKRVFVGLPTWDEAALSLGEGYAVASGDRADAETLDAADRALSNQLRANGFLSAVVSHTVVGGVLTIDIVPGPKVVPWFEGNVVFDRQSLLGILDLKNEQDRSPARLAAKIDAAYRKLGYLDVLVETELLGKPGDRQRTLSFRIREGSHVTVARRVYPCLSSALSATRIDEEIDSFLDEELGSGGLGDASQAPIDQTLEDGDVALGTHPSPDHPGSRRVYFSESYAHAREHLVELFRSEGYMFVEIGELGFLRGRCGKGSMPGPKGCKALAPPSLDETTLCSVDQNRLPLPIPPIDKKLACVPDPLKGIECAPELTVVLPINPGPRSLLWDLAFDGTAAIAPATLAGSKVAGSILRMGQPLSLKDVEAARKAIVERYRDEGYAFVDVKVAFEYSTDKSRARVRFVVREGEQVVIDRIRVVGLHHTDLDLVRARLLIAEGGIYRARLVRASQDRLATLGVFSSVSIGLVEPNVPGRRKEVVVTVVERPRHEIEAQLGFAITDGVRGRFEYGFGNWFGRAITLSVRARASWQNFFLCPDRSACPFYDKEIIERWTSEDVKGSDHVPRRISLGASTAHTPFLGADVRTSLELVHLAELRRDYLLKKLFPLLSFDYSPIQPLHVVLSGDLELNQFRTLGKETVEGILRENAGLAPLLRIPEGSTSVTAVGATVSLDYRDNRLDATKNGYVSLGSEWVRSNGLLSPADQPKQDFLHLTCGAGMYFQLPLPKRPVLAFELLGGINVNVGRCFGVDDKTVCDTYPDRLFYLGGVETNRGFFPGTFLPQDKIDELSRDNAAPLGGAAARGGNVYINQRVELRVPAFSWGGFVLFVDASNAWLDPTRFRPWILRYSVGPGLSVATPVGSVAFDFGFNLSRYEAFNEPLMVFNFSIGRF